MLQHFLDAPLDHVHILEIGQIFVGVGHGGRIALDQRHQRGVGRGEGAEHADPRVQIEQCFVPVQIEQRGDGAIRLGICERLARKLLPAVTRKLRPLIS